MASKQNQTQDTDPRADSTKNIETIEEDLELRGLRKDFGDLNAVDSVDLEINAGGLSSFCSDRAVVARPQHYE